MLEDLTIKNFALIDSVSLEFGKGFTVLSGETGAGKSILIGALSFVLGGKAELKMIRPSASEAQVSATFLLDDKIKTVEEGEASSAKEWLLKNSIEHDDNRILIRRVLRENGKSSAWIGGVPVTRQTLQEFASFLVDIH
ncbi:MAG: AAA family ATPase, partial [Treponema sp.]|nr:AAA family ATPase [Treponema sp.]